MYESTYFTRHAAVRAQQRGVPPLITQWLADYGEETYTGNGLVLRHFSQRSVRRMEREIGRDLLRRLSEYLRCYSVESSHSGLLVTVGKRYKRVTHS